MRVVHLEEGAFDLSTKTRGPLDVLNNEKCLAGGQCTYHRHRATAPSLVQSSSFLCMTCFHLNHVFDLFLSTPT